MTGPLQSWKFSSICLNSLVSLVTLVRKKSGNLETQEKKYWKSSSSKKKKGKKIPTSNFFSHKRKVAPFPHIIHHSKKSPIRSPRPQDDESVTDLAKTAGSPIGPDLLISAGCPPRLLSRSPFQTFFFSWGNKLRFPEDQKETWAKSKREKKMDWSVVGRDKLWPFDCPLLPTRFYPINVCLILGQRKTLPGRAFGKLSCHAFLRPRTLVSDFSVSFLPHFFSFFPCATFPR